jgi:hypothetical protein
MSDALTLSWRLVLGHYSGALVFAVVSIAAAGRLGISQIDMVLGPHAPGLG